MIVKNENNVCIRTAIIEDLEEFMKLYLDHNFGISIHEKPTEYQERTIFNGIVTKKWLDEEILIITLDNKVIGYAAIQRKSKDKYYIGHMIIESKFRKQGFSRFLLDTIKQLAANDDSSVEADCLYGFNNFFLKEGFTKGYQDSNYIFNTSLSMKNTSLPAIFPSYEILQAIEQEKQQKEIDEFKESLKAFKLYFSDNPEEKNNSFKI